MKKDQKTENRHHWKGHGGELCVKSSLSQPRITTQPIVERLFNTLPYNYRENETLVILQLTNSQTVSFIHKDGSP